MTESTQPVRQALVIVDVQRDFCEGGALAVEGGAEVASRISDYLADNHDQFATIIASQDWHRGDTDNGGHFAATGVEPDFNTTWPVHCVAGSPGADFHPNLGLTHVKHIVRKGYGEPAYSASEGATEDGTTIANILADLDVTEVSVCGLATDYCVLATCLDLAPDHQVTLLPGLHAGVSPATFQAAIETMRSAGVHPPNL